MRSMILLDALCYSCYIVLSEARGAEHEKKVETEMSQKYSGIIAGVIGGLIGLTVAIAVLSTSLGELGISVEPLPIIIGSIGYAALLFAISDRMTVAGVALKRRIRERINA